MKDLKEGDGDNDVEEGEEETTRGSAITGEETGKIKKKGLIPYLNFFFVFRGFEEIKKLIIWHVVTEKRDIRVIGFLVDNKREERKKLWMWFGISHELNFMLSIYLDNYSKCHVPHSFFILFLVYSDLGEHRTRSI